MSTGTGSAPLLTTPLTAWHRRAGAQLVDFAGWEMPVSYSGIVAEHLAVRERAGLFDISHMGRFFVEGAGAEAFLQGLLTNDLRRAAPGTGQYTLALNEQGGVRDDLIVFRLTPDRFLVIMNASNRAKILEHVGSRAPSGVAVTHRSDELAMIALQGPRSPAVLDRVSPGASALKRFAIAELTVAGRRMLVSRTGYTGEDGFEFYPEAGAAVALWEALADAGKDLPVLPCGLGSRDGLRLEVAYPLYGHEIDETTSPWEAGLGWVVKMDKGDFLGRDALARIKAAGLPKRLVGLTVGGPGVPRQGYPLTVAGAPAGAVTSGTYSPCLKTGIALGYCAGSAVVETGYAVIVRGRPLPAERVSLPFWKKGSVGGAN